MNSNANFYFDKAKKWQDELRALRVIVLNCELTEEVKWGVPCYTYQKNNIVLLHSFKEYCAILFIKGALLADADGLLIQQTVNTQAARQIRFTAVQDVAEVETALKACIYEAIEVERIGLTVQYQKVADIILPEEFQQKLADDFSLKTAFYALTPGRQRAYIIYFSEPKQAKTRESRIEKTRQQILNGKGLTE